MSNRQSLRWMFGLVGVLVAVQLGFARPAAGGVIISEIMYNPQGSDRDDNANPPFNREWVEIYNNGTSVVDLDGWQVGDSQDGDFAAAFPTGTFLNPQQALVVTGDSMSFDANWDTRGNRINRIQVADFPVLANSPSPTNETLAIRNAAGQIVDAVNYDDTNGWPKVAGSDGASIFLLPSALDATANNVGVNWKPSSQGVYGANYVNGGGIGENHGSPGIVVTETQPAFVQSPDASWSMVVLPDTQNYVKNTAQLPIFQQMNHWIVDNQAALGIQLVVQEGDVVNNNNTNNPTSGNQTGDQQWTNARAAMSILDGHVPYILAAGNHDFGTTSAQNRNTQINDYFQPSDNPLVDPAQGGILKGTWEPGRLENAYYELAAPDGRKMLIFSLEFGPRQAVIDWAEHVAAQSKYADSTAVLLTHAYVNSNETRFDWDLHHEGGNPHAYSGVADDTNDGQEMWDELVKKNGNFELVLSGHVGGDEVGYLASVGEEGNLVHQMLFNAQFEANAGNGWMRIIEFLDDGKTARVRTYSPYLDLYRTDAANQFEIQLSQLFFQPGDFDGDGDVDGDDLSRWEMGFGTTMAAQRADGDADGDGDVDGADFLTWQRAYSNAQAFAAGSSVPEPSTALLACCSLLMISCRRRTGCSPGRFTCRQ